MNIITHALFVYYLLSNTCSYVNERTAPDKNIFEVFDSQNGEDYNMTLHKQNLVNIGNIKKFL